LFSTRERENRENWPAFVFAMQSPPLHQQFLVEKGELFSKGIPHDVHARSVPAAEGSNSGADESALKGTAAVRSHNAFCFLLHRRVGAFIGAPFQ
jgi:hypothetical protein